MPTSRVKTNFFLTFEIAAKWQNVCYTRRYYRLILLISQECQNTFSYSQFRVGVVYTNLSCQSFQEHQQSFEI